jgi:hypothetical protein
LGGCNQVVSSEPWFTQADAEGAPQLRDGLWRAATEADCRFKETEPVERWPDCADAFVVRDEEWLELVWDTQGKGRRTRRTFSNWAPLPFLLAGGEPPIIQFQIDDRSATASGETGNPPDKTDEAYEYVAMRPAKFDVDHRAVEFAFWSVACGPLPAPGAAPGKWGSSGDGIDDAEPNVTDKPFPGLTVSGNNCIAESQQAVRRAAQLSEMLNGKSPAVAHWVRDGYR